MKNDNILLEPYYRFVLLLPQEQIGHALTDISSLFGSCDSTESLGDMVRIMGRGPVSTFMDYPTTLRAYTHGKGSIQFQTDGYDICHDAENVIETIGYDCGADVNNSAGSVFCSHGAGYLVNWDEADAYMHLPVESVD